MGPFITSIRYYAEWLSPNATAPAKWSSKNTGSSVFHEIELANPQPYVEDSDRAQDGRAYYAMASVSILVFPRRQVLQLGLGPGHDMAD